MNTTVFVLYDGIKNSVFEGQILLPLLHETSNNSDLQVYIVSFENDLKTAHHLCAKYKAKIIAQNFIHPERLQIDVIKKTNYFLGTLSVVLEAYALNHYLKKYTQYKLIARGPIAGRLCQYAITSECTNFILQARGLLAQEFLYHKHLLSTAATIKNQIQKLIWYTRYQQLYFFEKAAYTWQPPKHFFHTLKYTIESVSTALIEYLYATYKIDKSICTLAHKDLPQDIIPATQKLLWRTEIRSQLQIDSSTHVYVYNGSCKPWQCFKETVIFFKDQCLQPDQKQFLLVLSQDIEQCKKILTQQALEENCYIVLHVPHDKVVHYLCASDVGIIFREPHIINWVSRPTKVLEYQAASLKILHNNTVAWLGDTNVNSSI